ncbi:glycosyltransferase [Meridianimarinicoccus sp. RP-17]|uniref:glycosyltransferase n=1 Tax=Meridianimarinicoccus zhengii TaxID=2056810 RepID=UPI000DAB6A82|nr:glycosyltransferase [Phycocomes zhengii]
MNARAPVPKVGYVVKRYPRFSETFIVNEILAHEAAGTAVEIFALRPVEETHFQDRLAHVRAAVTRLPDKQRTADALWRLMGRAQHLLPGVWTALGDMRDESERDVAQAILLAIECRARGVDHLHAHFGTVATTVARLAATLAGIGYSFTAHAKDIYFDYAENVNLAAKLRDARHVVTVSDFNATHLRERFGPDAAKVVRLYNGLDLDQFTYRAPQAAAADIVAVGRLIEKKGFNILIEAIRLLHAGGTPVRCRIVGGGDDHAHLAAQIASEGLEDAVELMGPRPQSEVVAMMRAAAVLACPSITGRDGNRDGLPTVLLEAMALGTPVIATDVTGIPELVRDGHTGLCVPEGDPVALADGLARLLGSPDLRRQLAVAGRRTIEAEYNITANAAVLRSLFFDTAPGTARRSEVA